MSDENTNTSQAVVEEVGSALAADPDQYQDKGKEGQQEPPKQATRERAPKADLGERLQRAESAIQRHKETSKRLHTELQEVNSKYHQREQEYVELQRKLDDLKSRLGEGDFGALEVLGLSLEEVLERYLDPGSTRVTQAAKRAVSETERKLQELERKLQEREAAEREASYNQEIQAYLRTAAQPEFSDLHLLDEGDVVELGKIIAPELAAKLGRPPTMREIATEANRRTAIYHQRIHEAYLKRTAPKESGQKVEPPPKTTSQPTTVPQKAATQKASTQRRMTLEERKAEATKKLRELNGDG